MRTHRQQSHSRKHSPHFVRIVRSFNLLFRALDAMGARTGPNDGPIRALKGGMIFAKTAIGITREHT